MLRVSRGVAVKFDSKDMATADIFLAVGQTADTRPWELLTPVGRFLCSDFYGAPQTTASASQHKPGFKEAGRISD